MLIKQNHKNISRRGLPTSSRTEISVLLIPEYIMNIFLYSITRRFGTFQHQNSEVTENRKKLIINSEMKAC